MDKGRTMALFASAMNDAQQVVVDRFHDEIETAERRGFHLGEAQAFRALIEGRETDVETLLRHYTDRSEPPTRADVERACENLRRHFSAVRASHVAGAPPEGAFTDDDRVEREGVYVVHVRTEVHAHSGVDARIQITSLLESGTHEDGAENAITDFKLTSPPVYLGADDSDDEG